MRIVISVKCLNPVSFTTQTLGETITAQTQKIEALKQRKKGLMQGLFTSLQN